MQRVHASGAQRVNSLFPPFAKMLQNREYGLHQFKAFQAWVNFFAVVVKITVDIVHVIRNSVVSRVSDAPQVFRKFF